MICKVNLRFVCIALAIVLLVALYKGTEKAKENKSFEAFHDDEDRELVPMIAPGEQLVDYEKRVIKHMYEQESGKPPLFDGEYLRDKFDNQRPYKPLKERIFFDEL